MTAGTEGPASRAWMAVTAPRAGPGSSATRVRRPCRGWRPVRFAPSCQPWQGSTRAPSPLHSVSADRPCAGRPPLAGHSGRGSRTMKRSQAGQSCHVPYPGGSRRFPRLLSQLVAGAHGTLLSLLCPEPVPFPTQRPQTRAALEVPCQGLRDPPRVCLLRASGEGGCAGLPRDGRWPSVSDLCPACGRHRHECRAGCSGQFLLNFSTPGGSLSVPRVLLRPMTLCFLSPLQRVLQTPLGRTAAPPAAVRTVGPATL